MNWKDYSEKPTGENLSSYPTLLDIVDDVVGISERKHLYKYPLKRPEILYYDCDKVGRYFMVNDGIAQMPVLMPMSRTPFTFYRGQWKFFDNCLPTLYRYEGEQLEYQRFLSQCQIAEMILVMETHPVIIDMSFLSCLAHPKLGILQFPILYYGLAQHYGINTDLLDLSNNIWAAAFFAATRCSNGEYLPYLIGIDAGLEDRYGVIYRLDYETISNHNRNFSTDRISPIGLQYFNRPGRQCAFVKQMEAGENFNDTEGLDRIFFRHDNEVSRLIFTLSQFGKQFFPEDSLAHIVREIKKNNRFCRRSIELVRNIYYPDFPLEVIEYSANEARFELTDTLNASFDPERMEAEVAAWFNGGKERYTSNIMIWPVCLVPFEG